MDGPLLEEGIPDSQLIQCAEEQHFFSASFILPVLQTPSPHPKLEHHYFSHCGA